MAWFARYSILFGQNKESYHLVLSAVRVCLSVFCLLSFCPCLSKVTSERHVQVGADDYRCNLWKRPLVAERWGKEFQIQQHQQGRCGTEMAEDVERSKDFTSSFQNQDTRRVPGKRNRVGCLTCRQRKKRCDNIREICGHCTRLNLICHWQKPQDPGNKIVARSRSPYTSELQQSPTSSTAMSIPFAPDPMHFLPSDVSKPAQQSLDRKLALRYYIQTFTPMLTTSLENNGFLSVLLPMAIEDKPLLDLLIAWSSSHLSLSNDVYHVKALEHRSTALTSFATSLSGDHDSPEISLAGCLVFCSMSAILGDTTGWHNHLRGAAQIIKNAGTSSLHGDDDGLAVISRTYEGRWLLRNFAYHDILMSITADREPLIPGQYWISEDKTAIDSYFGLASEPMALISKISSLNGDMLRRIVPRGSSFSDSNSSLSPDGRSPESSAFSMPMDDFSARAFIIERELQQWECGESADPCLISLAESYRSAALIYLYRVIRSRVPETGVGIARKIVKQVSAVVRHVGDMPLRCLPECTLLFPLFMAGGETTSKVEILFIRGRLQHIATYRHFHNAASALSVLEELWLQHTSFTGLITGEPLDWLDILRRRNWKLALS